MRHLRQQLLLTAGALLFPAIVFGDPIGFVQTNLVSNGAVPAATTDSDLKNPWGISFGATSSFWIADNHSGLSTIYNGFGAKQGLVVTIPPAPGSPVGTLGAPTGTVSNPDAASGTFMGDRFLFATEDGILAGWQPASGTNAVIRADSAAGDVYKGLAILDDQIYAADFANAQIDVWDSDYNDVSLGGGAFTDPNLPSGYSPFNIQALDGALYVAYAKKETGGDEEEAGAGFGFVDKYDAAGSLLQRIVTGVPGDPTSPVNAPWGLALAPAGFGDFGNALLVGNFGDGLIHAFDPVTGALLGTVNDSLGNPIVIDGLWGLAFGNGGTGFDPGALYFTAGLNDEEDGLFGRLDPLAAGSAPEPATLLLLGCGISAAAIRRRRILSRR